MKKTIKILSLVALFLGIISIHSIVSATGTNGIVFPIEEKMKVVRTDEGNKTTIRLLDDGYYYQEEETLSDALKEVLGYESTTTRPTGVLYYIPVPSENKTKYESVKIQETVNEDVVEGGEVHEYTAVFADENFEQIPLGNSRGGFDEAVYIMGSISVGSNVYDGSNPDAEPVARFLGGEKTFDVVYYDAEGEVAERTQYTFIIEPQFRLEDLKIGVKGKYGAVNTLYDGSNKSYISKSNIENGEQGNFIITNVTRNEDLTSQAKYTIEDEDIISISKDGTITSKKTGTTKVTVEVKDVSTTVEINIRAKTNFSETITEQQIQDLIDYAKDPNSEEYIYYSTMNDTKLSPELLKASKELNKDIMISVYKNGLSYLWILKAENIVNTDISMDLEINEVDCFVEELKDREGIRYFDFKHSGNLPGKASITIYREAGIQREPGQGCLYYYNEETKKCEYVSEVEINDYEDITFTLEHCSKYVVSNTKLEDSIAENNTTNVEENQENAENAENTENRQLDNEPKAGEGFGITMINVSYMILIISVVGMSIYKIKK